VGLMKMLKLFSPGTHTARQVRFFLLFFVSLFATLLGGGYFFRDDIVTGISSVIINIGLDPQRTQLVVALLMTAAAALFGGLLGRRKFGTLVGASIVFWFGYLASFIQAELLPVHDAGGHLKPLDSQALVNTSLMMMGLALLCAFIGAAVGIALAEVVLDPWYTLLRAIWRYFARRRPGWQEATQSEMVTRMNAPELSRGEKIFGAIGQWLGVGAVITLLVLSSNSGDLFIFAPDNGIHISPVSIHGTLVSGTLVSSALRGQHKNFLVYLPPSYTTPQGRTKRYPVLYLLHGSPGTDIDWTTGGKANESADTLIATKEIPELIMVFPDGNGRPKVTSEWANSFDHRQLIETYVVNDLVQYVDQHYRTIPDPAHRAIGGLSMGGFGAMNIAEQHPNVFGSVISLGGYYKAEGGIWGKNAAYMRVNSPLLTFPKNKAAWKLHIYLGAATKDQPYYNDTKVFMSMLRSLHVPYRFDLENGYHRWRVWELQMYNALHWLKWA
jgi:S-formylglutathione hydrolase FrmB